MKSSVVDELLEFARKEKILRSPVIETGSQLLKIPPEVVLPPERGQ